jgi:beta-ribofuranosylaminobenzene 5'-phosphate synthase
MRSGPLVISAPSRLELTLIDLSLNSRRVNGSVGISIAEPRFECSVNQASQITIEGDGFEYADEAREFLVRLHEETGCGQVRVNVIRRIPPHRGFGSKTATLLAIGRAAADLFGIDISTATLALLARRARTSGVGVNTFDRGGFLIDGGHPVAADDNSDRFVPTRFSTREYIPHAIFERVFPWPILIILPVGIIVEGTLELEHFRAICPYPRAAVHEIAYIVCFLMTTAVVEQDYAGFCDAVNELQRSYLKSRELQLQSAQVRYVEANARHHGIDAIGLSSNGPALYALSRSPETAEQWLSSLVRDGTILDFWWTSSPNHGAHYRHPNGGQSFRR